MALRLHLPGAKVGSDMARLLLVDDDRDVVDAFVEILRDEGHEVRVAHTGREGLQALRTGPLPELVVLDVDMPVLGGPEMAHQMLLHDAGEEKVPVVLVSARHDLPQIAARMGTPYFVQKSGDIERFLSTIRRALDERRPPSSA